MATKDVLNDIMTRKSEGVRFAIWVAEADAPAATAIRETLEDVPVGRAFEVAMKYMRDEGWDIVTVIRERK